MAQNDTRKEPRTPADVQKMRLARKQAEAKAAAASRPKVHTTIIPPTPANIDALIESGAVKAPKRPEPEKAAPAAPSEKEAK